MFAKQTFVLVTNRVHIVRKTFRNVLILLITNHKINLIRRYGQVKIANFCPCSLLCLRECCALRIADKNQIGKVRMVKFPHGQCSLAMWAPVGNKCHRYFSSIQHFTFPIVSLCNNMVVHKRRNIGCVVDIQKWCDFDFSKITKRWKSNRVQQRFCVANLRCQKRKKHNEYRRCSTFLS